MYQEMGTHTESRMIAAVGSPCFSVADSNEWN